MELGLLYYPFFLSLFHSAFSAFMLYWLCNYLISWDGIYRIYHIITIIVRELNCDMRANFPPPFYTPSNSTFMLLNFVYFSINSLFCKSIFSFSYLRIAYLTICHAPWAWFCFPGFFHHPHKTTKSQTRCA